MTGVAPDHRGPWDPVIAAVGLALSGDVDGGRRDLLDCWERTTVEQHAERCVLAHYLADLEADVADEVAWDERALAEYGHVADTDLAPVGIPSARGLAASLHLNLGHGYLRQGRVDQASDQLEAGLAAVDALGDDGYGAMVRSGLDGLRERVARACTDRRATGKSKYVSGNGPSSRV